MGVWVKVGIGMGANVNVNGGRIGDGSGAVKLLVLQAQVGAWFLSIPKQISYKLKPGFCHTKAE
jgi:hypothetical protein